jgi:hypothetical protein
MTLFRLPRRAAAAGLFCVLSASIASAAEAPVADAVVELPRYVVTDSRELPPPEAWRYGSLPGFEILSSASDRTTQRLISDFQMFRQALEVVWPMPTQLNTPVLLILCGKGNQFESFVPPKTEGSPEVARASVYLKGRRRSAIVIDVASKVVSIASIDNDDPSVDATRLSIEHNKQLYREYVHYLLSRSDPRLPAWFEEGMAQIVMAMKFEPSSIEFGRIEDPTAVSVEAAAVAQANAGLEEDESRLAGAPAEDRDFNAALARRALLPMGKLLSTPHDAPEVLNPLGNNTWAKQCYAFVHFGLFGQAGKMRKPFTEFLLRSTRGPVDEAVFRDCFRMSYKDMNLALRGYIEFTDYQSKMYRAKDGRRFLDETKIALRDATPAEVGRIKGQAKALATRTGEARSELIAPYIRGERDPELLAALGDLEHQEGKDDRAKKFLVAAVQGKTAAAEAYRELAQIELAEAKDKPAGKDGQLSSAQVSAIRTLVWKARTLPPTEAETYELWAETLLSSEARPTKEDAGGLIEGVKLFPNRLKLVYETAALAGDAGLTEAALSIAEYGLKATAEPKGKAKFEALRSRLAAQMPAAAAPSTSAPAAKPGAAARP